MEQMAAMGYTAQVEQNDKGRQQNVIAGDPDAAEMIIGAHYDTPATILLPDLQIPRNFPVYLLWQIVLIGGLLLLSLAVGAGVGLLTKSGDLMILAFFLAFIGLMWLQLCGFANRHNANDNTSGVAALLETMARIPEEERAKVAFILFDNCEKGRKGAKAFAADHLQVQHTRLVVSLDSVGVGEHMLVMASSLAKQLPGYEALQLAMEADDARTAHFHSSVTTRCNGDFRAFKCGVGVMACRQLSGVGLYLGDLHTARDTETDQQNIAWLAGALERCIRNL
jgi:hypothetical protein